MSTNATDMSALELKAALDRGDDLVVVDVREPQEYQISRIAGSMLIPLGDLPQRYAELDRNAWSSCQCSSGVRSAKAAAFLRSVGFPRVVNLTGGILAWSTRSTPPSPSTEKAAEGRPSEAWIGAQTSTLCLLDSNCRLARS